MVLRWAPCGKAIVFDYDVSHTSIRDEKEDSVSLVIGEKSMITFHVRRRLQRRHTNVNG